MTHYMYEFADENIGEVAAEVAAMQRVIGHKIPPPNSQQMIEELAVMPQAAKAQGQGVELMDLARRLYARGPQAS